MTSSYAVGFVGYGGFSSFLHAAYRALPNVRVVGYTDPHPRTEPADLTRYPDLATLIADGGVEIVVVVTPPATHADFAVQALEAGCHVQVDKPLATSWADAQRIAEAAARTGRVATTDFLLRYTPLVEWLHEHARAGTFGRLRRVTVENYAQDESLPPGHWFWDRAVSGGIFVEHAVHFIDLVHGCTDAPVQHLQALAVNRPPHGRRPGIPQQDRVAFTALYADGTVVSQFHSFDRPDVYERTSLRFVFDLAEFDFDGWIPLAGTARALHTPAVEAALRDLPGVEVRFPEAGGHAVGQRQPTSRHDAHRTRTVRSGGVAYEVGGLVEASFGVTAPKFEVYARAAQGLLADMIRQIEDPAYRPRVTLAEGLRAVEVAVQAAEQVGAGLEPKAS